MDLDYNGPHAFSKKKIQTTDLERGSHKHTRET